MSDYKGSHPGGEGRSIEDGALEAKLEEAVAHLARVRPVGLVALTAIPPDGGPTKTKAFGPDDEGAARQWLEDRTREGMNLYWTVNPTRERITSKAKKTDIENLDWIHVDIDPVDGADPAEARAAALTLLGDYKLRPTLTLDSGGGIQAFFRIEEPGLYIGCNLEAAEEAECYTRQLEAELAKMIAEDPELRTLIKVDGTHDCCRLMRLPGTINRPNKKKRAAGREPRLASVIEYHPERVYSLGDEIAAAPPRNASPSAGQAKVQLESAPPRLRDLDELPETVTKRTRMLIVQGDDPDDQQRYASRSEVTFAVCCELVRANCSNEQIAAVLLDPDFGISVHTRAQQGSLKYAERQIERARAEVEEPMLAAMNANHAVIEMYGGSKVKVISWEPSEVDPNRKEIVAQSFDDFRNRYMNKRVQTGQTKEGNPVYSPAGKWWLEHPLRRQYRNVVFRPNEEVDEDEWNIWQGLAVTPEPGEWPLLRRLIEEGLAGGDEALAKYIIGWSAFGVQNPDKPAEVALTFIGGKGTGKSTFGRIMCRIFGQHGVAVAGEKSLTGNFNKHLHGCAMLLADEAVPPGNRNAAGLVKNFITDPTIIVEPKGIDAFPAPNRLKVIIASNNTYVVDASDDERRYAVCKVSRCFAAPPGPGMDDERVRFWRDLRAELDSGGIEAFLHDLLAMDLGDWHPRYDVPQTSALNEQRAASLKGFDRVLFDILEAGDLPPLSNLRMIGDDRFVLPSRQLAEYSTNAAGRKVTTNEIGNLLGDGQPDKEKVIHTPGLGFEKWDRGGPKGWIISTLRQARAAFDRHRFEWQWDDSERWGYENAVIDQKAIEEDRQASTDKDAPY